jgi:hypothetical protein
MGDINTASAHLVCRSCDNVIALAETRVYVFFRSRGLFTSHVKSAEALGGRQVLRDAQTLLSLAHIRTSIRSRVGLDAAGVVGMCVSFRSVSIRALLGDYDCGFATAEGEQ